MRSLLWIGLLFFAAMLNAAEKPFMARDMALIGVHDLQGRGAYQPVIHAQGGRWIAYVGHHAGRADNPLTGKTEENGTSIIDVTDPARPQLLHHLPGPPGGGAQMVRVCNGRSLPRAPRDRVYLLRTLGDIAHEVWDVTQPAQPRRVSVVADGLQGTHKNWWECDTGIAYLVSGVPSWRTWRMTQVFDLSDPAHPRHIRDFGLSGQEPGGSGDVPTALHGPISTGPAGNRVYFGYGTSSGGILQIVDRDRLLKGPFAPTADNLRRPQAGRFDLPPDYGAHTVLPLRGMAVRLPDGRQVRRDFVVITNEALSNGCGGTQQKVWMIDVSDESRPVVASTWAFDPVPGDFCARPGRIGSHASNENPAAVFYGRLVFISHFNAGVRVLDIRDPFRLREVAYYVPDSSRRALTTNNVEVDDRGYIYMVDRLYLGMHIIKLTGEAAGIADLSAAAR